MTDKTVILQINLMTMFFNLENLCINIICSVLFFILFCVTICNVIGNKNIQRYIICYCMGVRRLVQLMLRTKYFFCAKLGVTSSKTCLNSLFRACWHTANNAPIVQETNNF